MVFLRPILESDRERILDILTSGSINKTYMLPDFETLEDAQPLFRRLMALSREPLRYVRAIALEDGPVGFLNDTDIQGHSIELGYVIHPDFQGRGYMTQALELAMDELFEMGYREVIAGAFSENTASIRVMEKCEMVRLDKTEQIQYRGSPHTCVYYSKKLIRFTCCFCGKAAEPQNAYALSVTRVRDPGGREPGFALPPGLPGAKAER